MMNQIHMWQMGVDLCLVTSILVFAFRWMKTSRAQALLPKTLELEATLRSLITEADAAGRHLNEQLLRREQNLQRYLGDVEEAEARLSRSIALGDERSKEIQIGIDNCRELIAELKESYLLQKEDFRQKAKPTYPSEQDTRSRHASAAAVERPSERQVEREVEKQITRQVERPIDRQPQKQIERQIEKEVIPVAGQPKQKSGYQDAAPRSTSELQRVYAAAELLLKQGQQLEQVIAQTRLPEEEVRMLSQMIEIERDEEERKARESSSTVAGDPRLGALGSIRRQTTTL
jgi:hypothetical protein